SRGMMVCASMYTVVAFLVSGVLLPAPTLGKELIRDPGHCSDHLDPQCSGSCKPRCAPNESLGLGSCGTGCQCCQPNITHAPCDYGKQCGSGGTCRTRITCLKGEKRIPGSCGTGKTCICCAPDTETCPVPFKKHGSEYFYFHDTSKMNWDDALNHCKSLGGSLAEPANMDDFIVLIESSYSHMKHDIWLGATDQSGSWEWLSGGSVPSALWPVWPGNQPSGDGHCMQIHYHGYSGFFLNDYHCHVKGYFVCECTPRVT
ncbi:unnamed protein product, partial [Meganyctiphanes norvegica]